MTQTSPPAQQDSLFNPNDDTAKLREENRAASVEAAHLRDMWMRLIRTRHQWADGVRAAADRRAREQAHGLTVAALPDTLDLTRQLAHAVLALPERPSEHDLATVRKIAGLIDSHDPRPHDDVRAISALQAIADAQINEWRDRASEYWNQSKRTRDEILAADDTYGDLVAAGWKPPARRAAQHRAKAAGGTA